MDHATIARVLGIGRVAIGAGLLAAPRLTGGAWLGEPAQHPGGQLAVASLGARDMALGAGTLWALGGRRRAAGPWLLAGAGGDLADLAGVLRHREGLTPVSAIGTALLAGGAAAAGLWIARELD
jgi:hypothetical protein